MIVPLAVSALAVSCTFLYASFRDIRERRVPFRTWYPMLAVTVPMAAWFYLSLLQRGLWGLCAYFLALVLVFSVIFYAFAAFNFFGGADAWALIFLCVSVPAFPFEPLFGVPPLGFLPFSVLTNALILNLCTPLLIFSWNAAHGRWGPFPYAFLGFPVPADSLPDAFGFVMEEVREGEGGRIERRFIRPGEAIGRMVSGKGRLYTRDLKNNPGDYAREMELFRRAGTVWISYGIPFLVPLTAGLLAALFAGDLLFVLIEVATGA